MNTKTYYYILWDVRRILKEIEDGTRTEGTDYGMPHISELAKQAVSKLDTILLK